MAVNYDSSYYKQPNETMADYMVRLAGQRAQGILGGGGMLDAQAPVVGEEITSAPLGEVQKQCPAGYVLRDGACVPVGNGGGEGEELAPIDKEASYNNTRFLLDNPALLSLVQANVPLGGILLREGALEGYVRNAQNEATGSQGFFDYLFGRDGDVVLGDKASGGTGTLVGDTAGVVEKLFADKYAGTPFDASRYTSENIYGAPVTTQPIGLPPLFGQVATPTPAAPAMDMTPLTNKYVTKYTDSGTGTDYTVQSTGSWNANDKSTWDTSGQGGNADGSYDISSWFSEEK